VIEVRGLSAAKRRALALADNQIAQSAGWDRAILAAELPELAEVLVVEGLDISVTGFAPIEIDQLTTKLEVDASDPADVIDPSWARAAPVTKPGDLWDLGHHRILCGDARDPGGVARLMRNGRAAMAFLDPPCNICSGDIAGGSRIKHDAFTKPSGELSREEFVQFLKHGLAAAASVSREGAVHFVCVDWRHIGEVIEAGALVYSQMLSLVVWAKPKAGQASFYRNQHGLIGVFRVGKERPRKKTELGCRGRRRSDLWRYPSVDAFRGGELEKLKSHSSGKPVALIVDAMRDCTHRGDIVLDPFGGCGTTLLAAERLGRRAYTLELAPRFADLAIKRWQAFSHKEAVHAESGLTFDEVSKRTRPADAAPVGTDARQRRTS
jgi:DNA modification methylase